MTGIVKLLEPLLEFTPKDFVNYQRGSKQYKQQYRRYCYAATKRRNILNRFERAENQTDNIIGKTIYAAAPNLICVNGKLWMDSGAFFGRAKIDFNSLVLNRTIAYLENTNWLEEVEIHPYLTRLLYCSD